MGAGDRHIAGPGNRPLCGGRSPLRGYYATSQACRACATIRAGAAPTSATAVPTAVLGVRVPGYPGAPSAHGLAPLAEAFCHALRSLGHDVDFLRPCAAVREIVIGHEAGVAPGAIVFSAEQILPYSPHFVDAGRHADNVHWVHAPSQAALLRERGVRTVVPCPVGYSPVWERLPLSRDEDVDVLFYGRSCARRWQILRALEDAGVRVTAVEGVYGAELDALIARSKVALNLHFYEHAAHEIVRTGYLFANRRCVVTEGGGSDPDLERLAQECAVVCVSPEEIVDACRRLVADEGERRRVAIRGYEAFRRTRFVDSVAAALRASGVECVRR